MGIKQSIGLIAVALVSVGCATPVGRLLPIQGAGQSSEYLEGDPVIYSRGMSSRIAFGTDGVTDPNARLTFYVLIENTGPGPITVGPESVSVRTDDGKELQVFSAEQLEREARDSAFWTSFGTALAAAGNSMAASNAGYTTSSGYVSGNTNYGNYSGSYAGSSYNSAAAVQAQAVANAENRRLVAQSNARVAAIMENSQSGAFQRTTIQPGGTYFSPVTVDRKPSKSQSLSVTIKVNGDVHDFKWSYSQE